MSTVYGANMMMLNKLNFVIQILKVTNFSFSICTFKISESQS